MKTILLFQSSTSQSNRSKFEGVYRYAQTVGWHVQSIQYGLAARTRKPLAHIASSTDVRDILDFWKPYGCIVEGGEGIDTAPQAKDFKHTPVVFLDRPRTSDARNVIYCDNLACGRTAARELLSLGLESFAYVGWWTKRTWSEERGKVFAETIRALDKQCYRFDLTGDDTIHNPLFEKWIKSLPRPCGVFTANDLVATRFSFAASQLGFAIPDDFAVLGVDNDEELCENAPVTISSLPQDCLNAGFAAGKLLNRILHKQIRKPIAIPYGVLPPVHRASTRRFSCKDERLTCAYEFIRRHACLPTTDVNAVARAAGCSRRQLETLFSTLAHRSILKEIHAQRIAKADELLKTPGLRLSEIAERCGYHSLSDFSRAYRRTTGHTPSSTRC